AFTHGRHTADVQHDAGSGSMRFRDGLAEIVGDVSELCAGLNIVATLDQRIKNAVSVAGDVVHFAKPYGVLDRLGFAGKDLQIAHHIRTAGDKRVDVVILY